MGEEDTVNKINFSINDGESFFANEMSITFGPAQFALDFKNISPRVDMRNQDGSKTFVMKHNVILVEPFQIKQFAKVLNDAISRYEMEYGNIEPPQAIKKAEQELQRLSKQESISHDVPSYFG
ncbi:MAG: hypothetical protein KatS3mg002_0713 [Candidatus Woesearchaeota archaeon]|nr:MAG: hypothetical protein KatS3mg002_0713 [Candidatus Woesearchaeota archaeon]